ncbi:MAG: DEAD/DEAH box helicase [Clostridia bacterium]|nr:DEAD/DEAH box helicase [Clostridia bacterium]
MKFEPYFYQKYAEQFILDNESAGLLLDMGMGKTVVSLTAVDKLLNDYFAVKKVLVIAPLKPAKETWLPEIEKWDHLKHLKASLVIGTPRERVAALQQEADIYIINRENVVWLVEYYKNRWPFDMVVIDELSSFKSSKAQRFRALKKVRKHIRRIVGLTGTPSPNGLLDLWPEMYLLDEGKALGKTLTSYRDMYFLPDKRNQQVIFSWRPKTGAEEAIYKKLEGLCVSMKAADYLKLPERLFLRREVELSEEAKEMYKTLERDTLLPFADGDIDAPTAAVLTNKLFQSAGGASYEENGNVKILHDDKLDALDQLIEEANGQPVLVFYAFRHELERIKARHPEAVDIREDSAVSDWNKGKISVLLAHPASAGHGLNLQAGGHIAIWYGLPTSLELYQQANKRLHRPGQKETVLIHRLLVKGTYDCRVLDEILTPKEIRQNALLEALKARIREGIK